MRSEGSLAGVYSFICSVAVVVDVAVVVEVEVEVEIVWVGVGAGVLGKGLKDAFLEFLIAESTLMPSSSESMEE